MPATSCCRSSPCGGSALELVGYDGKRKIVEYAGVIGGDRRHVLIREIHQLRALVQAGALDDGRQVAAVHVVFPDAASARQERRPLLDVGAKVFHLAPSGKTVELTDGTGTGRITRR
jgi:hypothetical protein